ncbi:unnamed protein product [Trifolium pratense]|uniref:Uncharacterized protein n=1 Tax=Trifolium pratense TaxID=57577 RepID=A0ACB0IX72_TRIPR|nr:unnamed protein product [Trifolium pratense]
MDSNSSMHEKILNLFELARIRGCDGRIRRSEDIGHEEFLRCQAEEQHEEELVPVVQSVAQPVVWPGGPIDTSLLTRTGEGNEPVKMATVLFRSKTQAMNVFIAKNGTYCLNNRISIHVLQ